MEQVPQVSHDVPEDVIDKRDIPEQEEYTQGNENTRLGYFHPKFRVEKWCYDTVSIEWWNGDQV
jgi:hypothetical protein